MDPRFPDLLPASQAVEGNGSNDSLAEVSADWGLLASQPFDRQEMRSIYFFAGNWRCCHDIPPTQFYENPVVANEVLYTTHPTDPEQLGWSERSDNPTFILDMMIQAGANVVTMSSWGERGSDRWAFWAPMQTSTLAHDQLFNAALDKNIAIMPAIESSDATIGCGGNSPAYHFVSDFPGSETNPAPQLVTQIKDLLQRYITEPAHPVWPSKWVQMYDQAGNKRYAINILHVASNMLAPEEHERFARGFDLVANKVWQDTGILVGFTLDLLPEKHWVNSGECGSKVTVSDTYTPSPEMTGPYLRQQASFLAVQAFMPEIWSNHIDEDGLITYKFNYLHRWMAQGVPVMLDVSPGYDAHLVFPGSKRYGFNEKWRTSLSMFLREPIKGITFNTWNGYTEGFAAVPTLEYSDVAFRWIQQLFKDASPQITVLATELVILPDQAATLTIAVAGAEPLAYQWYQGTSGDTSRPIPGATGPSYTIAPPAQPGHYWVRVSSLTGHADSTTMTIKVTSS